MVQPRLAVMICFLVAGMTLGSWFPRIPDVQHALNLAPAALGFALIGTAIGALCGMPATNLLISRFGSRRVATIAGLALCAVVTLPTLAPNLWLLFASLFLLGLSNGILDVSMNVQAVLVEAQARRPIMSTFHALFSVGGLIGAAVTAGLAAIGVGATANLAAVGVVMAGAMVIASTGLLEQATEEHPGPAFVRPPRALFGLGAVAFIALISEGAMADWSAVYMRNDLGTSASLAAVGYGAFTAAMVLGRLSGDWATARLQPERMIRYGGWLIVIGLGAGLLLNTPWSVMTGFAAVGLGLAAAFPVLLSVAGAAMPQNPGVAVASVAMIGYTGFLVGPPLIGFLAQIAGLRVALCLLVLLGLAMVWLARWAVLPRQAVDVD